MNFHKYEVVFNYFSSGSERKKTLYHETYENAIRSKNILDKAYEATDIKSPEYLQGCNIIAMLSDFSDGGRITSCADIYKIERIKITDLGDTE